MNVMHLSDLPERTQDYLKVLWDLSEPVSYTHLTLPTIYSV